MVKIEDIMKELQHVIDPEIGVSILEMNLIDDVKIEDDKITVLYHLTAPMCPPMFAVAIGEDIKNRLLKLPGVKSVKPILKDHYLADDINKKINPI